MKKLIDRLLENFAKGVVENVIAEHERDPFEKHNEELVAGATLVTPFWLLLCFAPMPYRPWIIAWPFVGIAIFYWRFGLAAREHNSNRWAEFLIAWKLWPEVIAEVYMWPLNLLVTTFRVRKGGHSFRRDVESIYIQDMFKKCGRKDHAVHTAVRMFDRNVQGATETGERLQEIPEVLVLKARATGAIGATAMTMATATVNATAATAPTNAPEVKVTTSGWVATETHTTFGDSPKTTLEYARFRLSLDDTHMHAGLFVEMDGDQLQYHNDKWLPQFYLNYSPSDNVTIRAGHLFVAAGWCTPAPHSVETINYPRLPFSFTAYGVQGDVTYERWHFLGDISGNSSLSFDDRGQFNRLEGSGRVEYALSKKYTLAVTGQASKEFARTAFDVSVQPTPWANMRAMIYGDVEHTTSTVGSSLFMAVHPLKSLPNLELHGQADVLLGVGPPTTEPVIMTGGARMLFKDGKYSVTADFEHGLGEKHKDASDGFYLRVQQRF